MAAVGPTEAEHSSAHSSVLLGGRCRTSCFLEGAHVHVSRFISSQAPGAFLREARVVLV
jgi:hypothetical protein